MRRNSLFRTSSFRLTLLYAGLFTASVAILFGIIYWWAAGYAAQDEADDIGEEYVAIQDEMTLAGPDRITAIIANHVRQHQSEQAVYLLQDADGHKIAGNIPEMAPKDGSMTLRIAREGKTKKRAIPAKGFHLTNGDYLLIGQDPQALREMKDLIARAFGASLAVTLFLAILGGVVISKAVRGRVELVARTSRAIVGGDLAQRVPLAGSGDEFDDLAGSINDMLERIEDLMRSMRQVSNDIAHELRTPLTRLRQRLEQARRRGATVETLHEALEASLGDIDAILDTFNALLRIAQIEAGTRKSGFAAVDLSELLETTVETYQPVAEGKGQTLSGCIAPVLRIWGDRGLLVQMVVNLVENAIRHSQEGAAITVSGVVREGAIIAEVRDTGPGIPEDLRKRVFERLYRLEASRTTPGSGLGLSLVAAIGALHGISLELSDNAPGLCVRLIFPAAPTPAVSAPQV